MKIRKILIPVLIMFTLGGCKKNAKHLDRVENSEDVDIDESLRVSTMSENEYKKIPYYTCHYMNKLSSFKAVTKGETIAKFIIKENQSIDNVVIKSNEYTYEHNESHGKYVNEVHEAYYHNNKVAYKDNSETSYTTLSLSEYLSLYGTYPHDKALEGYSISEDAIVSITKTNFESDKYTFHIVFDNEKATNNVKIQMHKVGGLNEMPTFELVELDIKINNDFILSEVKLHSKYKAKKGVTASCEQNYTVTYSSYNEALDIPNLDYIKTII